VFGGKHSLGLLPLVQFFSEYDGATSVYLQATSTLSSTPEMIFGSTVNVPNTHGVAFLFPGVA
jgi:hypothetical protein